VTTSAVVTTDCVLLINPTSGRGRGRRYGERAEAVLSSAGWTVRPVVGGSAAEAVDLARREISQGAGALVVVGGDGMVSAALPLVAGSGVPLGLIPAGTGNDTARFLGLPRRDPEAAARIVTGGRTGSFDLGRVRTEDRAEGRAEPHWFATVLACGLDSKVNERANRMRRPKGPSRYTLALLAELFPFRAPAFRLELDGAEPLDLRCMLIAVGNGPSYGGGMRICPQADPQDGRFQVTAVSEVGKATLLRIFPKVFNGGHVSHPAVTVHQAGRVVLRGPDAGGASAISAPAVTVPAVSVWADGEYVGVLPAEIDTVPGALRAFVPAP
jgi:diacylglycerol kinase (ATP)